MNDRKLANRVWPEHEFSDAVEAPVENRLIKKVTLGICAGVFIMVLWSIFSFIEEIAKARGQVVPLGHKQVIQSQLGGTLASVRVEVGDVVKKGDIIVSFSAVDSESAEEELESQKANVMLKIERLSSFQEQRTADFSALQASYPSLVEQQQIALNAMNKELESLSNASASELAKSQAELQAVINEIPSLKHQISASEKTLKMMNTLGEDGSVSKLQILESEQKLDAYQRELKALEGKQEVLTKEMQNLKDQLAQKKATMLSQVGEQQTEAQAELLVLKARLRASSSQVSSNTVHAPVDGIIQSIPANASGTVIPPGGTVAVIVPTTENALMEAKLSPRDIGFISVGQKARIKIDAFDYSRYGAIDGVVEKISPTTDADEKGGVFYKVQISIKKPYFGESPGQFDLIPGMTGEADIVTGQKSIFQYLWKPVFTNVSSAFGER